MGTATDALPKGMFELRGRPLIAWQLEALRSAGIADVAIVRGYRGDALPFDATYFDNPRWAETNMVASLACAAAWLSTDTCLVGYADLVYPAAAVQRLLEVSDDLAVLYDPDWLALWRARFADPLEDAETFRVDERQGLVEIGARPTSLEQVRGQYMGLLRLSPLGSERLLAAHAQLDASARDRIDMTGLLARLIEAGTAVRGVAYDSWWCEIDSASDLRVAEAILDREVPA
jgi:choline kinase